MNRVDKLKLTMFLGVLAACGDSTGPGLFPPADFVSDYTLSSWGCERGSTLVQSEWVNNKGALPEAGDAACVVFARLGDPTDWRLVAILDHLQACEMELTFAQRESPVAIPAARVVLAMPYREGTCLADAEVAGAHWM